MAGYIIADVNVTDPAVFEEYRKLVPGTIEKYGGEYIVRGGQTEVVEGGMTPGRLVVIKFDSYERAKEWYNSDEYEKPMAMRKSSANTNVIIVEGV